MVARDTICRHVFEDVSTKIPVPISMEPPNTTIMIVGVSIDEYGQTTERRGRGVPNVPNTLE